MSVPAYGGGGAGQYETDNEKPLNFVEYTMARNLQKSSIAPRAAREHLVQHVVAMEELQFQQAGRSLAITPEFKDHIDKYWQGFMEDVVSV